MAKTIAGMALVLVLAVVAAGCGSSSKPAVAPSTTPAGTTATGPGGAQSAAFEAFRTCLQKAGIASGFGGGRPPNTGTGTTAPTNTQPRTTTGPRTGGGFGGGFGGAGANLTPAQQKAFAACRSKLPAGAQFGGGGQGGRPGGTTANPAFARYTKCLSQHGVKLGTTATAPGAFQKASAACAKYRPSIGGGGSGPTTTTG